MSYFRFVLSLTRMRTWREAALTIGAVLGTICIVATIAAVAFDVRPLVFRSGSMSPTIETGDLAFAQSVPASELSVGDVVSVIDSAGTRVTHRITDIDTAGDRASLTLRGDANETADAQPYEVAAADRVLFDIPKAGYAVSWLSGPAGIFAGGLLCGLLLFIAFGPGPRSNERRKSRAHAASLAVVALGLGGLVGTGLGRAAPTMAAWNDSATAVSGTLKTYTVPKPMITDCTEEDGPLGLGPHTATISWTDISTPYTLDYTATIVETSTTMTVTDNGSTKQTIFSSALLGTVFNRTYNIRIQAKLPAPNGTWVSVTSNQQVTVGLLGLTLTCGTSS